MTAAPEVLFAQAVAAHQCGDLDGAEALYRAVLRADPNSAAAPANLAAISLARGQPGPALDWLNRSLTARPGQPAVLANRAQALTALGREAEALADWEALLALEPGHTDVLNIIGDIRHRLGDNEGALQAFSEASRLEPHNSLIAGNRAAVLHALGRDHEALEAADLALELDPASAKTWTDRGSFLMGLERDEEAAVSMARAVVLAPDNAEYRYNLAGCLGKLRRIGEAAAAFDAAIALKPDYASALWNKSLLLLAAGRWAEGWPLFEWRWTTRGLANAPSISGAPVWLDGSPLEGTTILVHYEQGLGDTLLMLRYLPLFSAFGARVVLAVQPALAPLCEGLADQVLKLGEAFPPHDFKLFMMSLPLALGGGAPPPSVPYLAAPAEARGRWANKLGPRTGRRIGLVWSGNPGQANDRNRSLALDRLVPWLQADADFVSLQVNYRDSDVETLRAHPEIADFSADLTDFGETAALIETLDLIITIDTATAHLCGALGKPVWVLAPYALDFRWGLEGSTTPWYPTTRVFRAPAPGQWDGVIGEISALLVSEAT